MFDRLDDLRDKLVILESRECREEVVEEKVLLPELFIPIEPLFICSV